MSKDLIAALTSQLGVSSQQAGGGPGQRPASGAAGPVQAFGMRNTWPG
jgi:hypothetical protein